MGDDLNQIGQYMSEIMPDMQKIPGMFGITTNVQYTNGRFVYILDPNKVKDMNSSSLSVATTLMGIKNSTYDPNGISIKEFGDFGKDTIDLQ